MNKAPTSKTANTRTPVVTAQEPIDTTDTANWKDPLIKYVIIGLIIFAGVFSSFFLMTQSLRLDEAQSLWQTSHSATKILYIIAQDVHVPFYHLLLHAWQILFGNAVPVGRAFSLIFFLLTIPFLYVLGKESYSKSVGLFATLLFALSPFLNWYGSEIRMYSLLTLLTVLNQLFFVKIYNSRASVPPWTWWLGFAVTALLGIYTHYFFMLMLFSEAIFFLVRYPDFPKHSFRNFVLIALGLAASFMPWLWYVRELGSANNTQPLLVKPDSVNVFNTFSQFIFGYQNDRINTLLVSLWPVSIVLGFLSLRKGRSKNTLSLFYFLSILIPVLMAFVLSITFKPVFLSRYLILVVPSLYLFLSAVIATYSPNLNKLLKSLLIVVFVISLLHQAVSATTPVKENYEKAVDYLHQKTTAQDTIIISAPFTIYPIEYYYKGPTKLVTLPIWDRQDLIPVFDESKLESDVTALTKTNRRAYLLLSYNQGYEETIRIYFDTHYQRIEKREFSPGLTLYVYQIRYDIPN